MNKEIIDRYQTHDELVKQIVVPELNRCLLKEGDCAK